MPIVFAFCRTAASVRFIAFATSTTGVLVFEWALSCRRSSLVHGLRTRVFFFGMASIPLSYGSMLLSSQLARSDSIEVVDLCSEVPHLRWTKGGFARSSTSTWTRSMRRWSNAKDFSLVNHPTSAKSRRATNSEIAEAEAWTSVYLRHGRRLLNELPAWLTEAGLAGASE